jgi:hypothetical protein
MLKYFVFERKHSTLNHDLATHQCGKCGLLYITQDDPSDRQCGACGSKTVYLINGEFGQVSAIPLIIAAGAQL